MKIIALKGRAKHCSREFIRAWLQATACILAYHNHPITKPIEVRIHPRRHKSMQKNRLTGGGNAGWCLIREGEPIIIALGDWLSVEGMATVIVHETIHAAMSFSSDTDEKCVSTLTAKLKPTIAAMAAHMLHATYKNAAYIALTRVTKSGKNMPYRATDGDYYDDSQWDYVNAHDYQAKKRRKDA